MTLAHQVPGLSFSGEQLHARRQTLGASEVAAIAGLNPRRTALDVYLEKKGIVEPFAGNEFTEWGLRLEEPIAQKYAEITGFRVVTSETLTHETDPWMSCTPDRLVPNRLSFSHGVEIKRFGDYREDDFGVPGTDQVPLDVAAQCMWSMLVTNLRRWDVAVLLGQADFRVYHILFDEAVARQLYDVAHAFWFGNVLANVEPPIDASAASRRTLQQRYGTHGPALIDPSPDIVREAERLVAVRDAIRELESEKMGIENRLQQVIGEANAAGIRGVCSWKLDRNGRPRWKDIAERLGAKEPANAALVDAMTTPPSRRFLFTFKEG